MTLCVYGTGVEMVYRGYGEQVNLPSSGKGAGLGRCGCFRSLHSLALWAEKQHEQGWTDMGATEDSPRWEGGWERARQPFSTIVWLSHRVFS